METGRETHRTTDRLLDIFEQIADHPGEKTLTDISKTLAIPKSTISPILYTLTARGYITSDALGRYTIGSSTYLLGRSFLGQFHFLDEVERILVSMTDVCMEASHFATLSGGDVFYLKKVESPQPIRMVSSVGRKLPAYSTALGKALLMDCTKTELAALYPDGLTAITPKTITDIDKLYDQLLLSRKQGYTTESEESNEDIRCLAVPVRKDGRIVAALSIATPVFRFTKEKEDLIRVLLFDAQKKIERLIDSPDVDLSSLGL